MEREMIDSGSADRVRNNTMRHQYKVLNDTEKRQMLEIKDKGLALFELLEHMGQSRELSLAKTKVEEAVMWGVKHVTG